MAHTDDGGPAFPFCLPERINIDGHLIRGRIEAHGMSLRDYFAAKALPQVIANYKGIAFGNSHADAVSDACYVIADAMLRARAAQSPAERQADHLKEFGK